MNLNDIQTRAIGAIDAAASSKTLEEVRVAFLGKQGEFTAIMKTLGTLPPEQRKQELDAC